MFSDVFLAQTQWEIEGYPVEKTAYMACHFSPYGMGLSNIPKSLPKGSILLLDDSMPPNGHDPQLVEKELRGLIEKFGISAVLIDFQGKLQEESLAMATHLTGALSCPTAVTQAYAKELGCPVFLSPTPVNMALRDYLSPWLQQGVYLEIAPTAVRFTVTEKGCSSLPMSSGAKCPLQNEKLHCHYNVEVFPQKAVFSLYRNKSDLQDLTEEAVQLGVCGMVGLYQELSQL